MRQDPHDKIQEILDKMERCSAEIRLQMDELKRLREARAVIFADLMEKLDRIKTSEGSVEE